ncbi:coproporphyrinogen-III oxidase family protein [Actinoplanes sp. CA-054009]
MYDHPLYHWPPKTWWTHPMNAAQPWGRLSTYVHFPYCRNICDFCNYETRLINKNGVAQFGQAVAGEIGRYARRDDFSAASLTSIFFGGGTASLMPIPTLTATIDGLRSLASQSEIPEVTLECEPGTISRAALEQARLAGVNRIGVCAQSFDDEVLRRLTRKHGRAEALRLIDDAHAAGIANLHVDLMYGLPHQSLDDWRRTIEFTAQLPIQHISAYKLYVFKNGAVDRSGAVPRPVEESEATTRTLRDMHDLTVDVLGAAGFEQYTLTEFARPGNQCDYLLNTFGDGNVLPLGPSAFGRCGPRVWRNSSFVQHYQDAARWDSERRGVTLTPAELFKRHVLLGLWLLTVDVHRAALKTAVEPSTTLTALVGQLAAEGLLHADGDVLQLDPAQRFGAGTAMRRLAELDSAAWTSRANPGPAAAATTAPTMSAELRSLLRVLRSDPALFVAMRQTPAAAVTQLEHRLPGDERAVLLAVVRGDDAGSTALGDHLRGEWAEIINEHRRVPRQRTSP